MLYLTFQSRTGKMADKLSYVSTPITTPYMYQTIPERLRRLATEDPERLAFIFYNMDGQRIPVTRKEIYQKSVSLAKSLYNLGVRKGTPVGVCMNNSVNTLYVIYGVSLTGALMFTMATNLKDGSDITGTMNEMKAEYLIMDASVDDANWTILNRIWPADMNSSAKIKTLKSIICNGSRFDYTVGRVSLSDLLNQSVSEDIKLPTIYPEDTLMCFCTSGSTGKPKLVLYSHFGILNWSKLNAMPLNITNDSIYFCDRQFSWAVGYPRLYVATGCTRVFIDTRMSLSGNNVSRLCDIIEKEKADVVYMPGYLVKDVLSHLELSTKFNNVNVIYISGERFSTIAMPLKGTFCKKLLVWYGATEAGGFSTFQSDTTEHYEDGIVGLPVAGGEMKIVDDEGNVVPVGASGELHMRCTWRFIGYHGMPELFETVVDPLGWFHSGDVAHMRKDGQIVVEGRNQELISMQTVKYFPWEIEKSLKKCPGAKFAIAVGVPDVRLTQVVCACVVPEEGVAFTEDTLKTFCDETFLEEATSAGLSLKPRYHLIFKELPLTSSGKIDRRRIGIIAKERLGL